jgi:hypothetical protein
MFRIILHITVAAAGLSVLLAMEPTNAQEAGHRARTTTESSECFHQRATAKTGLLIPLYVYPENIHVNHDFNRVIKLKRMYREVPFWVIVNPASGPGEAVDANYTKAIDRLIGAGCVVLGYLPTDYGRAPFEQVETNLQAWRRMYPRTHGVFFDEMIYEANDRAVAHQVRLNKAAHDMGYWPTVGNPGTDTPGIYFAADAADVIVIHEAREWPTEEKLHGNYFGGYSDFAPHTRATLMYGQKECDSEKVRMVSQYTRWIYVTQDTYQPDNPDHPNPWDQLSIHLESLCEVLND